jgi:hypothetical protein
MQGNHPARALLAAAITVTSCSSSGLSGTDYAGQFASEFCGLIFRCCSSAERLAINGNATDQAACEADFRSEGTKAAMLTAQGQSGHSYGAANAQRCLDALKTATCTAIDDGTFAADCGDVYVGATAAGQLCFDDSWCKAGLVCAFDMPDSEGGTCRVAGAFGESCGIVGCGPGLYCATMGTCATLKDGGATCAGNHECATGFCGADMICSAAPPVCAGPPS